MTLIDLHRSPGLNSLDEPMTETQDYMSFNVWRGDNIHLKILVPSIAAGAIIGKGGETIAQVQKEAGARVKMSKANDFYPATTERVCLIMGAVDAVRRIQIFIMEKIREKPDPNPKLEETNKNFERHRQVKILVPNSTAGMIIGKSGNYIKQIKEESGAYIQISQKSKEINLPERCVTIAGDMESNKKAVDMILQKIVEDPQSGSCPNISYADYTGPVASANPTGSPFANPNAAQNRGQEMVVNTTNYSTQGAFGIGINGNTFGQSLGNGITNMNLNAALGAPQGSMTSTALENLKMTLRGNGYSEQATEDISNAMNTLASYGILGMIGLNQIPTVNSLGTIANMGQHNPGMTGMAQATMQQGLNLNSSLGAQGMMTATPVSSQNNNSYLNTSNSSTGAGSLFGPVGSGSSGLGSSGSTGAGSSLFGSSSPSMGNDRYVGSPMLNDSFTGAANYTSTPTAFAATMSEKPPNIALNQNSFGLGTSMYSPTEDKQQTIKQDLEVAESIVGAILGPGGKGIVELQQFTQTNIQISKKGVYVPGTRNRIVTITGTPSNIGKAQYLIQQRIQQEELKRARQASR